MLRRAWELGVDGVGEREHLTGKPREFARVNLAEIPGFENEGHESSEFAGDDESQEVTGRATPLRRLVARAVRIHHEAVDAISPNNHDGLAVLHDGEAVLEPVAADAHELTRTPDDRDIAGSEDG